MLLNLLQVVVKKCALQQMVMLVLEIMHHQPNYMYKELLNQILQTHK